MKLKIWLLVVSLSFVAGHAAWAEPPRADVREPIVLEKGGHLRLDDQLIARSEGVARKVISPPRFLTEPIVTGELPHQNWQPFSPFCTIRPLRLGNRFGCGATSMSLLTPRMGCCITLQRTCSVQGGVVNDPE